MSGGIAVMLALETLMSIFGCAPEEAGFNLNILRARFWRGNWVSMTLRWALADLPRATHQGSHTDVPMGAYSGEMSLYHAHLLLATVFSLLSKQSSVYPGSS